MKKRIFSLFMVFTLCFVSVDQVYADAGSLIIAGGSVAGGITAGAIAGPAVVAVFCAMMAFGMNVELTKASEDAGMTKTEFLKNKLQEYCNEAKISANTFNEYVLDQAQVLQDGRISISKKAGSLIEKFCNWLFENENVQDVSGVTASINICGVACPVIMPNDNVTIANSNNGDQQFVIYNQGSKPLVLFGFQRYHPQYGNVKTMMALTKDISTFQNFEITAYQNNNVVISRTNYNEYINNVYGVGLSTIIDQGDWSFDIPIIDQYSNLEYTDAVTSILNSISSLNLTNSAITDTVTGNMDDYDVSKHVLNPTQDQTIVINPHVTIPVPADKDVTIDVNTYIEAIQELIDGLRDDVIEAIDSATDTPITIEFDPTQDWDPTIEDEDDSELPPIEDRTPVVKDDIIPHDFDPDPMKFDLKGIFPFCIPWDVKDMLNKLSADPVAPSYTVNWMIPIVNERLTFTVNLSPFNDVALVCRNMELLVLCIGLAIVTRQLFLRG